METRDRKILINRPGGTAGKKSIAYAISLPTPWVEAMDMNEDNREATISFDGDKIIIEKKK